MKNFKVLTTIGNADFVFDSENFKYVLKEYKSHKGLTLEDTLQEIAAACHISSETVKKWYRACNGPGDISIVKNIAKFFNIDYQTLLTLKAPANVYKPEEENMYDAAFNVNPNTLKLISVLNDISGKLCNGIMDFADCKDLSKDMILYNSNSCNRVGYRIVLDALIDELHHDIISYYDDYTSLPIGLIIDEDDAPYIEVLLENGASIIVENGSWYYCG